MEKFKVGDRVKIRSWESMEKEFPEKSWTGGIQGPDESFVISMRAYCGKEATIIKSANSKYRLAFGNNREEIYCFRDWMFEPVKSETIVIYRNGDEVIALDKRDGKKAVAKCSPEDTFDFATGAKIAFGRLIGETKQEKPKDEYYNGKAVCVKSCDDDFTVGKVYTFINGETTDECGYKRPRGYKIRTLDEYAKRSGVILFIEYKGEHGDAK